jgi:hypothetical protein
LLPVILPAQLAFSGTAQPQLATEVLPTREDFCTHSELREANAGSYGAGMAPPPTPVWAYFDRTALPYGASPTRLAYALCKLCTTLSAEDRNTIDDNTSAAANERKKLAAELRIVVGHQDTMLRHLLSCTKADAEIKMFARSKLIESKEKSSLQEA